MEDDIRPPTLYHVAAVSARMQAAARIRIAARVGAAARIRVATTHLFVQRINRNSQARHATARIVAARIVAAARIRVATTHLLSSASIATTASS